MAKKGTRKPKKATLGWPLGFAPPGPPTRMIVEGPKGRAEVSVITLTTLDDVIEVGTDWEDDDE